MIFQLFGGQLGFHRTVEYLQLQNLAATCCLAFAKCAHFPEKGYHTKFQLADRHHFSSARNMIVLAKMLRYDG